MAAPARRTSTNDTGIEILPGIVCVDLAVADVRALTVDDLREAMTEADAQEHASNQEATELLGDLDLNPL